MALASLLVATGVFAVVQSTSLSNSRRALEVARVEVREGERRIEGLERELGAAKDDLESANERLGRVRRHDEACHLALGAFAKAFRMYYRYSTLASLGDVDGARVLRRRAEAVLRGASDEYRTCMSDAATEGFSTL